jgi:hypothetical protein
MLYKVSIPIMKKRMMFQNVLYIYWDKKYLIFNWNRMGDSKLAVGIIIKKVANCQLPTANFFQEN